MTTKATIRCALLDAIDWRVSMLDAGVGVRERNRRVIAEYKTLLHCYGGMPADPFEGATLVDIYNVPVTKHT